MPYGEDLDDPYKIYEQIMKQKDLTYPNFFKDKRARKLIEQFLNKIPDLR